ncbi:hypothetical protein AKO1_010924 [Acrasis kona]|uniref:Fido domain-containing protein n=1 Tax=Acrasis kona TaxID=1008807 RepID=A0AAW2YSI0_9EUKA
MLNLGIKTYYPFTILPLEGTLLGSETSILINVKEDTTEDNVKATIRERLIQKSIYKGDIITLRDSEQNEYSIQEVIKLARSSSTKMEVILSNQGVANVELRSLLVEMCSLLKKKRPLSQTQIQKVWEEFSVDMTYTSCGIEGNTYTREETEMLIKGAIAVTGKTEEEAQEILNHHTALQYAEKLTKSHPRDIKESVLTNLHALLLKHKPQQAGKYRTYPIGVGGSQTVFPEANEISALMVEYFDWLHDDKRDKEHPIVFALQAHLKLVAIHPYGDGNGRLSRLIMNIIAVQKGYPIFWYDKESAAIYKAAIHTQQVLNNDNCIQRMTYESAARSLKYYQRILEENTVDSVE